jgi:energy-converting hydrogenase Eha subunit G
MSVSRLLSPALRSGLVLAAGVVLIVAPLSLGLSHAAAATGLAVGVLAVALGLAGTAEAGRGTLPVSAQAAYDTGLAVGLLLAAVTFGIAGDLAALTFFGAVGVATLAIKATTSYALRTT